MALSKMFAFATRWHGASIIHPRVEREHEERRSRYLAADELARLAGPPGVPARCLRRHPGDLHFRPSTNPASASSWSSSPPSLVTTTTSSTVC
jgi:hypothetical protein